MNAQFLAAYKLTMGNEGIYSNDPNDPGGETNKGIARKKNPNFKGFVIIDQIKKSLPTSFVNALRADVELNELVEEFYYLNYWQALKLNSISETEITYKLFDIAVNQGTATAAAYLQTALNLLNNNQKHYNNVDPDGNIGPATLKAYYLYMSTSSLNGRSLQKNINTLLTALCGLQFARYKLICEKSETQEIYFYGWLNRL